MSSFSVEWLQLREPVDTAARNPELTDRLLDWRQQQGLLSVLDLASGTGANSRFLAPLLGGVQHWWLVDHDPELLAQGKEAAMQPWSHTRDHCHQEWLQLDLVHDWNQLPLQEVQLVTASALLDLVSANWLAQLAQRCGQWQATVFMVLSYDGGILWEPVLAGDEMLRVWVNDHQRTDKGFGPALGPDAVATLALLLRKQGYEVMVRPSPWRLKPEQVAIQTVLLDGWLNAAVEIAPEAANELESWWVKRRRWLECGESRLQVGHWDLLAWPGGQQFPHKTCLCPINASYN